MNASDLQKRFAPDFLITGKMPPPAKQENAGGLAREIKEAVYLYSSPLLQALRQAPQHEDSVYSLQDKVAAQLGDVPFDQFVEVLNWLQRDGVISLVQRDPRGNHRVKLMT